MSQFGLPYWVVFPGAIVIGLVFGLMVERMIIRRIMSAPEFTLVIATFAVGLIIQSGIRLYWQDNLFSMDNPMPVSSMEVKGVVLNLQYLWVIFCTTALVAVLAWFFKFNRLGKAMRAVSISHQAARLMGVHVERVLMASWGFVASAFVVGATFAAPGGAAAWGLTLVWMIPLGVLIWASVVRPYEIDRFLAVAAASAVVAWIWFVVDPGGLRHLMDRVGPVVSIANVLASVPPGLLGLERPRLAGTLLFVAATVPLATMAVGADDGLIHAAMIAAIPDIVVGTSAGAFVATTVAFFAFIPSFCPERLDTSWPSKQTWLKRMSAERTWPLILNQRQHKHHHPPSAPPSTCACPPSISSIPPITKPTRSKNMLTGAASRSCAPMPTRAKAACG